MQWLHDHGDEIHDPTGLVVGRMRTELGKGRALSQLLSDMENDGMIKREVRGRRTMMIKLVDDWGLLAEAKLSPKGYRKVTAGERAKVDGDGEIDLEHVDLTQLADVLLALVVKRAQVQPSQGNELEKLREKVAKLTGEIRELRDNLILAREAEAEQRRQADTMRESLAKLQRSMDKPKRGSGVAIKDQLSASDQRLLKQLMEQLPSGR